MRLYVSGVDFLLLNTKDRRSDTIHVLIKFYKDVVSKEGSGKY